MQFISIRQALPAMRFCAKNNINRVATLLEFSAIHPSIDSAPPFVSGFRQTEQLDQSTTRRVIRDLIPDLNVSCLNIHGAILTKRLFMFYEDVCLISNFSKAQTHTIPKHIDHSAELPICFTVVLPANQKGVDTTISFHPPETKTPNFSLFQIEELNNKPINNNQLFQLSYKENEAILFDGGTPHSILSQWTKPAMRSTYIFQVIGTKKST